MKQLEADIAIIGGGVSGLAAAVAAAEKDARVIVFEKASTTGGTSNMGMGPFAVESRLQREKKIALARQEAFEMFMNYTHWRVDARLVKAYIDKSGSTIDWLEKMGVEFYEPAAYFVGSNFTWHTVKLPTGGSGDSAAALMMKVLKENARKLGVQILLQTPAKRILKKGNHIAGVIGEGKEGEPVQANTRAVIVGTGGFGDNPELIKKYTGYEIDRDIFPIRVRGMAGEGIRMA